MGSSEEPKTRSLPRPANPLRPGTPSGIRHPKLLLGEGEEETYVFKAILYQEGITDVAVEQYGGKDKLREYLHVLKLRSEFTSGVLRSIGITRDADKSEVSAFQSVCSALRNEGLPVPYQIGTPTGGGPSFAVHILPGGGSPGMLEDVCLASVTGDSALPCVDAFFACVGQVGCNPTPMSKARVRTWLATRQPPDIPLGAAALKGFWNLNSPAFAALRQFVRQL